MDNLQQALQMLHNGQRMVREAKAEIRAYLTDKCAVKVSPLDRLRGAMQHGNLPYSKLVERAISCVVQGCDPEEVKRILEYKYGGR